MSEIHDIIRSNRGIRPLRNLLKSSPSAVQDPDEYGCLPLYVAVCEKLPRVVEVLLSYRPPVNHICPTFGEAALHAACGLCLVSIVRQLVTVADVDLLDQSGQTPLYRAARAAHSRSRSSVINLLVQQGARVDLNSAICIGPRETQSLIQREPDCFSTALFFDSLLYDAIRAAPDPYASVELLLAHGVDPNRLDSRTEFPPLSFAIELMTPEVTRLLLEHGANPRAKQPDGKTVLDHARFRRDRGAVGGEEQLNLLLNYLSEAETPP